MALENVNGLANITELNGGGLHFVHVGKDAPNGFDLSGISNLTVINGYFF